MTHRPSLVALLNSTDPAQVVQGVELLAALDDPVLEAELLDDSSVSGALYSLNVAYGDFRGRQFRCCRLTGPLHPNAPFSHLVALLLMLRQVQRDPQALSPVAGTRRIELHAYGGVVYASRGLTMMTGGLLCEGESPTFGSTAALLSWLGDNPAWQPGVVWSLHEILDGVVRSIFSQLTSTYQQLAEPLRSIVLGTLCASFEHLTVDLTAVPLAELPGWVRLESLSALRLYSTGLSTLPGADLSNLELCLGGASWPDNLAELPPVGMLRLEGQPDWGALQALLRRCPLRRLTLSFPGPMPAEIFEDLQSIETLSLLVADPISLPNALWNLPRLEHLSLLGPKLFPLPETPPPALKSLEVQRASIHRAPPAWRGLLTHSRRRQVWLLSTSKKIHTIKMVKTLLNLGLREAKELVESAPCLVVEAATPLHAARVRDELIDAGAKVVLR